MYVDNYTAKGFQRLRDARRELLDAENDLRLAAGRLPLHNTPIIDAWRAAIMELVEQIPDPPR